MILLTRAFWMPHRIVLAVLAVAIALWPLFMLFRIWAERWPFRSRGETLF